MAYKGRKGKKVKGFFYQVSIKVLSLFSQVILTKAENTMPIIPGFYLPDCGMHGT